MKKFNFYLLKTLIMSNITNKEALKDKIHEIHNYLRNNGAGYGLGALRIFNIFYGLKKLEEANLLNNLNLKMPECSFTYLLKLANERNDEILADTIYGAVLDSVNESSINKMLFYEIPKHIKSKFFTFLIKEINKITDIEKTCNVLLSGKVYEYFIGRESSISELGAYFTDRHIVNYVYEKLDLKLNENNTVKSVVDCFGGSGGFTTGYIDFLNKKYENVIQWTNEINNIYQYDVNEDVLKTSALEIFCMTGQMPNMDNNIKYRNSFTMDIDDKFDLVITNPPYGGDKIIYSDTQMKRDKIKNYIKKELETLTDEEKIKNRNIQLKNIENAEKLEGLEMDNMSVCLKTCSVRINNYAHANNIKNANDKEACSLILMMDLLKEGGTCAGVLKEGIFFNRAYTDLRKSLIKNFNVREIISIPADQFENTTTKTSILIFDNTVQKTQEIKFSELVIERHEEDKFIEHENNIVLSENKGDILKLKTKLISIASIDELNNNVLCSLHGIHYSKKYIVCGDDFELKKLGDLCDINKSVKLTKSKYNYVEISDINENTITKSKELLKSELPANAKIIATNNNILISCVRPKKSKMTLITDELKNIDDYVFSSAIANISLYDKSYCYYVYAMLYAMSDNFEKDLCKGSSYPRLSPTQFKTFLIPMPKTLEKLNELTGKISIPYNEIKTKTNLFLELEENIKNKILDIIQSEECETLKLGDLCILLKGTKHCSNISKSSGLYRFYNSSQSNLLYVDFCEIYEYSIIIGQGGIISVHFDKNFTPSKHVSVLQSKNKDFIELQYIYEFIKINIHKFLTFGSVIQWLNRENLSNFEISIPTNKKSIKKLKPLFEQMHLLTNEINESKKLFEQHTNDLLKEAIVKIIDPIDEINDPPKKLTKIKKTKKIGVEEMKADEI